MLGDSTLVYQSLRFRTRQFFCRGLRKKLVTTGPLDSTIVSRLGMDLIYLAICLPVKGKLDIVSVLYSSYFMGTLSLPAERYWFIVLTINGSER